jgi:hypothetical protein
MKLLRIAAVAPVPGTRHQRRACLPGRPPCGPLQYRPPKPPSKRLIIIEGIIGTVAIIGIDAIIGGPTTIVGTDGTDGTDGTGIIIDIPIIGDELGRRSN